MKWINSRLDFISAELCGQVSEPLIPTAGLQIIYFERSLFISH